MHYKQTKIRVRNESIAHKFPYESDETTSKIKVGVNWGKKSGGVLNMRSLSYSVCKILCELNFKSRQVRL